MILGDQARVPIILALILARYHEVACAIAIIPTVAHDRSLLTSSRYTKPPVAVTCGSTTIINPTAATVDSNGVHESKRFDCSTRHLFEKKWQVLTFKKLAVLSLRGGSTKSDNDGDVEACAMRTRIDEDLYSRQLYVMGKSAMARMGKADVLISGLRWD